MRCKLVEMWAGWAGAGLGGCVGWGGGGWIWVGVNTHGYPFNYSIAEIVAESAKLFLLTK